MPTIKPHFDPIIPKIQFESLFVITNALENEIRLSFHWTETPEKQIDNNTEIRQISDQSAIQTRMPATARFAGQCRIRLTPGVDFYIKLGLHMQPQLGIVQPQNQFVQPQLPNWNKPAGHSKCAAPITGPCTIPKLCPATRWPPVA